MQSQLIPPPELAPPSVRHLPLDRRIELWAELVDEGEALLLSALRSKIGPDGDLNAAYREGYSRHMLEHDRMQAMRAMAGEVVRAVLNHVWSTLEPLGHDCALIGGVALAAWNYPRATRDVDL